MSGKEGEVVCVTGGSGYIGSWLVRLLLERGYTVHATVKDLKDEKETKHLEALEGAQSRLHLFQIDLLHYDSIVAAVTGANGVFHLASPCIVDQVHEPEKELLDPAIKGTNNVLTAAKELGVRRVVVTSSISAITPSWYWPADVVKDENCWTDIDYCKTKGLWYPLSKTLAEKAAWEFAKEKGLDVVVVNPGTVMGPILPPALNASMLMILRLLQGCTEIYKDFFMGSVHVKDVALAHILVYENTSATGRHLCVEAISHYGDFAAKVAELCPEYKVPRLPKDTHPGLLRTKDGSKKLMDLGLQFIPMEQIIKDSVESLKSKGYIS
ncbi:cinnamoyl-CoA reductase CAD2-like [Cornus florida]|uniref:cinnamoyl-CoA reductase CAD2-like n=1 Tax=Cornus florida TaxID=4283 RepID=UPI002897B979|nr:cinnamoyl-CoA reductase CAD2-like [Cornus florida]